MLPLAPETVCIIRSLADFASAKKEDQCYLLSTDLPFSLSLSLARILIKISAHELSRSFDHLLDCSREQTTQLHWPKFKWALARSLA